MRRSFPDGDDDGLSNLVEYEVALTWGAENFTDPMDPDTDNDGMPDGWEFASGTHPKFDDSEEDQIWMDTMLTVMEQFSMRN